MDCNAALRLLEPYLDGELDRADARELEAHIDACPACREALADLGRLRHAVRTEAPRYAAPSALRDRIRNEVASPRKHATRTSLPRWFGLAAMLCLAFASGAVVMRISHPADAEAETERDLFASHWRALAATSPVDVVSTDKHTVRPWFAGKIATSPPVADFADQGFPLVGGRLDYAGAERVPVLVYRHDKHLIDVFVLPATSALAPNETAVRDGYTLMTGTRDGARMAVVSDLDREELAKFRALLDNAK
jgi:anti-sigma factor (TIGR02949 family)